MKKFMFSVLVCAALMTSCKSAAAQPGAVFDYQKTLCDVSGAWTESGEKYEVMLHFDSTENGSVLRTLTFSSPETLSGITVGDGGDHVDLGAGGMSIALEYAKKDTLLRVKKLFCLDAADITDIKAEEDGTIITGRSGDDSWQVETDSAGIPEKIIYEGKDMSCVFEITDIG